jgi:LAS superfamily LD-carboxypeptidase LdcB
MFEILGTRAKVNPPILVNCSTDFTASSVSSASDPSKDNTSSKNDDVVDMDSDTSESDEEGPRTKKKRRPAKSIANDAVNQMLRVMEKNRQDDRDKDFVVLENEKERDEKYLEILTKSQEHMGAAVDVLRIIANKI